MSRRFARAAAAALVAGCPLAGLLASCADESAVDLDVLPFGPGCGDGFAGPGELCAVAPGSLVIDTEDQTHSVLAVDLDADGDRDLVAITHTRLWIRFRVPAGFGATVWFSTAGADYRDVAAGDFDGDGDLDVAIADAGTDQVLIRRNGGGLLYPLIASIPIGDQPQRILAARLDGDARADLVVLADADDGAAVLIANGAPFAAPVTYDVGDAPDIALGDCDGSGSVDLLYVNGSGTPTTLRARRNSNGAFAAPDISGLPLFDVVYGYLYDLAIVAADLDSDGFADAAVSTSWSQLASATSDGDCTFTPAYTPVTLPSTYAWAYRLRAIDWDLDGAPDVAAPHGVLGAPPLEDHWSVVFGDGVGSFATGDHTAEEPGIIARDLAFLDADGDGDRDVAIAAFPGVVIDRNDP